MDREMKLEEGLYTKPVGVVAKTIFSDVAKRIGTTNCRHPKISNKILFGCLR